MQKGELELVRNYAELGQFIIDIISFTQVFEHSNPGKKIFVIQDLLHFLDAFKRSTQKEDIVELAKTWCEKEAKKRPNSETLPHYYSFFNAVKGLASEAKNPEKAQTISRCIDDAKTILEKEIGSYRK